MDIIAVVLSVVAVVLGAVGATTGVMALVQARDLGSRLSMTTSRFDDRLTAITLRLQNYRRWLHTHDETVREVQRATESLRRDLDVVGDTVNALEYRTSPHAHHWHAIKHEELHDAVGTHLWTYRCKECNQVEVHEERQEV